MKTVAVIQARMASERLPGKILKDLGGKPVLLNIVERARRAKYIDEVAVATSDDLSDDVVENFLKSNDIPYDRGSLENVLSRFYNCALKYKADVVIRLTADNALIDPDVIDDAVELFNEKGVDYLAYKDTLPLGMSVEIFTFDALKKSFLEATDLECLEHVTPYIYKNQDKFKVLRYTGDNEENLHHLRFTMDTADDYRFVTAVYDAFKDNQFSFTDVLELLESNKELIDINSAVVQKTVKYTGEK